MSSSSVSDDDIALKLMRLYRQAQQVHDPVLRQPIVEVIDGLIAALKEAPRDEAWSRLGEAGLSAQQAAKLR